MKSQQLVFEAYINPEDEEEVVGTLLIENLINFHLSQPSKQLESFFLKLLKRKIFSSHCNSKHPLSGTCEKLLHVVFNRSIHLECFSVSVLQT